MKHRTLFMILAMMLSFPAFSRPAWRGIIPLTQPDGTTVSARITGDEFFRITTTLEGNAVMQDEDGWWCYADFDENGQRRSSGYRVGRSVPAGVLSESRRIPYRPLSEAAARKRSSAPAYGKPMLSRIAPATKGGSPAIKHGLIILVQFSDVRFEYDRQDFIDLLTKEGYSRNGASGSAREYFEEQFDGKIDFRFDVSEIISLSDMRADYGSNLPSGEDKDPARMVIEACKAVDAKTDFTLYDDDNDGEIDNVFVFFAGGDEAEGAGEDCLWSHSWYIFDGAEETVMLDGKRLNRYSCGSELTRRYQGNSYEDTFTGIGTFCHEYCHTLGLPDLYDTDYEGSGGNGAGLWVWTSLMDGGNQNGYSNTPPYFNAIEREILGLCEPVRITADGTYTLSPVNEGNAVYRIDTDDEDEYYLLECRSGKGWDRHIGGKGMLVYHIDRSGRNAGYSDVYGRQLTAAERWTDINEVNCRADHQCADLLEADGRKDMFNDQRGTGFSDAYKDIRTIFYPQENADYISPASKPGFMFWSGIYGSASVTDIRWEGESILFDVINTSGNGFPPVAINTKVEAFPDAAVLRFESSRMFDGTALVEWERTGYGTQAKRVKPYRSGKFAVLLDGLQPGNKTYNVTILFENEGVKGQETVISFMTKKAPAIGWPYIYLNGVARNSDGTIPEGEGIPLVVTNASDAAEITWTFNDRPAAADGDLYFRTNESGTLKAHIIWPDGTEETILKEIIIGKEDQVCED